MNEPIQVQITKIKISKDKKTGNKIAAIQLTRIVGESDEYDGDLISFQVAAYSRWQESANRGKL